MQRIHLFVILEPYLDAACDYYIKYHPKKSFSVCEPNVYDFGRIYAHQDALFSPNMLAKNTSITCADREKYSALFCEYRELFDNINPLKDLAIEERLNQQKKKAVKSINDLINELSLKRAGRRVRFTDEEEAEDIESSDGSSSFDLSLFDSWSFSDEIRDENYGFSEKDC